MSTWVLLRGLMREQRHWGDFPEQFRQALPQAHIVTPDLPGNGSLHGQSSPASVAALVDACREQLRARGLSGPYCLLALSLGAMVAVEWGARYPQEVSCCVLINTSMRPFNRFYRRLRWQNYPAIALQAVLGGVRRQESLILRLTSNRRGQDAALLQRWIGYQRDYPVRRANALRQLAAAARFNAPPSRPEQPLLVLAGGRDKLVDMRCSLALAQAWNAECRLHPDAGHDLPLDDGAWVAAQVAQWRAATSGKQDEKKPRP
ncbi:MAG: alpha/beta hydrolase [Pseudomonadota bacterium]